MILVIGATGTIGSEVVKQLSAKEIPVRAFVRSEQKAKAIELPHVDIVYGDLNNVDSIKQALQGISKIFLVSSVDPAQVELQGNVVKAAAEHGVQHIVKISALGAEETSKLHSDKWHREIEKLIEQSGLAYTFLQPQFFMQNLLYFIAPIVSDGAIPVPVKDGKIGIIDTRDIAAVAAVVLTEDGHEGKTYLLTGPEALSFGDLAEQLGEAIGKPLQYIDIPLEYAWQVALGAGYPEWYVHDSMASYEIFSTGNSDLVTATVEEITKKRATPFAEFANHYASYFQVATSQ